MLSLHHLPSLLSPRCPSIIYFPFITSCPLHPPAVSSITCCPSVPLQSPPEGPSLHTPCMRGTQSIPVHLEPLGALGASLRPLAPRSPPSTPSPPPAPLYPLEPPEQSPAYTRGGRPSAGRCRLRAGAVPGAVPMPPPELRARCGGGGGAAMAEAAVPCRVQYLEDSDPFGCGSFPEPRRAPVYAVEEALALGAQLPAVHRLLGAPLPVNRGDGRWGRRAEHPRRGRGAGVPWGFAVPGRCLGRKGIVGGSENPTESGHSRIHIPTSEGRGRV